MWATHSHSPSHGALDKVYDRSPPIQLGFGGAERSKMLRTSGLQQEEIKGAINFKDPKGAFQASLP